MAQPVLESSASFIFSYKGGTTRSFINVWKRNLKGHFLQGSLQFVLFDLQNRVRNNNEFVCWLFHLLRKWLKCSKTPLRKISFIMYQQAFNNKMWPETIKPMMKEKRGNTTDSKCCTVFRQLKWLLRWYQEKIWIWGTAAGTDWQDRVSRYIRSNLREDFN